MNIYAAVPENVGIGESIFVSDDGVYYAYKGYSILDTGNILKIKLPNGSLEEFSNVTDYYTVTEADATSSQEGLLYIDSVAQVDNSIYKLETTYDVYPTDEVGSYEYLTNLNSEDTRRNTHF